MGAAAISLPSKTLFSHRPYWASRFGIAPFLPTTRAEMDELGWDSCDIIVVTGDAYIDHPSFGMALVGRLLESQGFRVGILSQPAWQSPEAANKAFTELGRPNLFWGVTGGNMDSMVNRYTSDRKMRSDDAYSPDGAGGLRPDRSVIVYAQQCRAAYSDVPVVIGGIESSLRRIAHYDYWSDKVRRSVLVDAQADMLVFGNAERAIVEIAHRLGRGEAIEEIRDVRGTSFFGMRAEFAQIDSTTIDKPGVVEPPKDPYAMEPERKDAACETGEAPQAPLVQLTIRKPKIAREQTAIRLPSFEKVSTDRVLYAHASRILHLEANPGNARALVQRHGDRDVWINPPPIPLSTEEMDGVYELPYQRIAHPRYGGAKIPAYEMIKFSVTIMRGCFGGCSFCSITEHEGRIIQNRSEKSILREIEQVRDTAPGFTGIISDMGGPTANMYRLACKSREIEASCRKPSCVFPDICENLNTDHGHLVKLYKKARAIPGVKKILIASGVRYDIAVKSPEWIRELAQHHTGGYLKIAPEHTEAGPLRMMMKPGIGAFDRFKELFDRYSVEAGKEQYLIPYFIAAHPGTTDEDMLNLAQWLKRNGFRADQVQAFLPSPMASASTMYHTGLNPLRSLKNPESVKITKNMEQRRLHKAFLRYHDANNWPLLRDALRAMGREDLIGNGKHHLIPHWQPAGTGEQHEGKRHQPAGWSNSRSSRPRGPRPGTVLTQHTGLPPRAGNGPIGGKPLPKRAPKRRP